MLYFIWVIAMELVSLNIVLEIYFFHPMSNLCIGLLETFLEDLVRIEKKRVGRMTGNSAPEELR